MATTKPIIKQPLTNLFGQIIIPGKAVAVITRGYSNSINTYNGVYLGFREGQRYGKPITRAVVEVEDTRSGWLDPTTGELITWVTFKEYEANGVKCAFGTKNIKRVTSLWDNRIFPID